MRVMLFEDQVLLREGLAGLFHGAGHDVVGSYPHAEGIIDLVAQERPDIVVLDIRLPPTYTDEGTRAAADLKAVHPTTGVLLLSQHVETAHTVELVAHGGFGYLLKDRVLAVADFLAAVERVANGGSALDPYVVGRLLHRTDTRTGLAALTDRELDVLRLMAQGITNAGVANRLFLSERTVEAHVRRLLAKLDIADSADGHRRVLAVLAYLRAGSQATTPAGRGVVEEMTAPSTGCRGDHRRRGSLDDGS